MLCVRKLRLFAVLLRTLMCSSRDVKPLTNTMMRLKVSFKRKWISLLKSAVVSTMWLIMWARKMPNRLSLLWVPVPKQLKKPSTTSIITDIKSVWLRFICIVRSRLNHSSKLCRLQLKPLMYSTELKNPVLSVSRCIWMLWLL